MENYNYVNVSEIKVEGNLDRHVMYKPKDAVVICFILGVAIEFIPGWISKILGLIFILLSGFVQFLIKDFLTVDIYDTGVVVYNTKNANLAVYLPYADMISYEGVGDKSITNLKFTMSNEQIFYKETFVCGSALRAIRKYIPKKEARVIREEEWRKSNKLALINPFKKKIKK